MNPIFITMGPINKPRIGIRDLLKRTLGRSFHFLAFASCTMLVSCSDYEIHKIVEKAPNIVVTPASHSFGHLDARYDSDSVDITIKNIGNETLSIDSIKIDTIGGDFKLTDLEDFSLHPSQSEVITLSYDPETYRTDDAKITINSNDPDEPSVDVLIVGYGDSPVIHVDPDYFEFGDIWVGCEEYVDIEVSNHGNVDLTVSDIEGYASIPQDFDFDFYTYSNPEFPWVISPSSTHLIQVMYYPNDVGDDSAFLWIKSDDPVTPLYQADQLGFGDYESVVIDEFEQEEIGEVDILFVVDNSGSMGGNQANLANNMSAFMSVFITRGVDFRMAFITTDDSSFVSAIITSSDADPVGEAASQIATLTTYGSPTEKGLQMSLDCLESGDCRTDLLRSDARLVVVYVSDEDDWSGLSSSDVASRIIATKSTADLARGHAIIGDVPGGCTSNGGAAAGELYYEVVSYLGGTQISICDDDWGFALETAAIEATVKSSFTLSEVAVRDTITVEVNGSVVTEWYYDESTNAVVFTDPPANGSTIKVEYAAVSDCE